MPWRGGLATAVGALLLAWPALLNGYPILFSDTQAFLAQADIPFMIWDKPWVYGPFLWLFHRGVSLWLPLAAPNLLVSHMLWLTGRALGLACVRGHVGRCGLLAAGSAAPWFAGLLMPDILAPVLVLSLFLLAFGDRLAVWERFWAAAVGVFACAAHLSHLPIAAAGLVVVGVLRRAAVKRTAIPLAGALALLLLTNAIGFGRLAISPFGAVFALAKLVDDGPARAVIARDCPDAGWQMCRWVGRLPTDSNDFLWNPEGPVWSTPGGPIALAPEAAEIVRRSLAAAPLQVLGHAAANAWRQLLTVALGDTLGPEAADSALARRIGEDFPAAEQARFTAARQAQGRLVAIAAPLNPAHAALLALGAVVTVLLRWLRHDAARSGLAALVLVGVLANAATTGALSHREARYQARVAWLLLLPAAFAMSGIIAQRGSGLPYVAKSSI